MINLNFSFIVHIFFIYMGYLSLYKFFFVMYDDVINHESEESTYLGYLKNELYEFEKEDTLLKDYYKEEKEKLKKLVTESIFEQKQMIQANMLYSKKKSNTFNIESGELLKKKDILKKKLKILFKNI